MMPLPQRGVGCFLVGVWMFAVLALFGGVIRLVERAWESGIQYTSDSEWWVLGVLVAIIVGGFFANEEGWLDRDEWYDAPDEPDK